MVPGRQQDAGTGPAELGAKGKIVPGVEIKESLGIAQTLDNLVVGLRRHDHEHAEDQRYQQPAGPRAKQRPDGVFAQHEARCGARNQKQQRQPPRIEHQHQRFQRRDAMLAFDMEPPGYVEHADVVEDQEAERRDPHPIQVNAPRHALGGGMR